MMPLCPEETANLESTHSEDLKMVRPSSALSSSAPYGLVDYSRLLSSHSGSQKGLGLTDSRSDLQSPREGLGLDLGRPNCRQ
jgi:hypothetical protein